MFKKAKKRYLKKIISVLLITSITTCYVVQNNNITMADTKSDSTQYTTKLENKFNQQYSNVNTGKEEVQCNTQFGRISEDIEKEFTILETVAKSGNQDKIKKQISKFKKVIADAKADLQKEISNIDVGTYNNSSTIIARYNSYWNMVEEKYEALEKEIESLENAKNKNAVNSAVEGIGELTTDVVKEEVSDLPFNLAEKFKAEKKEFTGIPVEQDIKLSEEKPENQDLLFTNDTTLTDTIKEETKQYNTTLKIYNYLKNNIAYEAYYGSRKGAVGTYDQKAGNDYDQASLMIALLRQNKIPAHYVRGKIILTANQAMAWTATDKINSAVNVLAALGVPTVALTSEGKINSVLVEHVWVEAYVPYGNYRGAGGNTGKQIWLPLDPSYKKSIYKAGVNVADIVGAEDSLADLSDEASYNESGKGAVSRVDVNDIFGSTKNAENTLEDYLKENGYNDKNITEVFGGKETVEEKLNLLPLSLPYKVSETLEEFADIPEQLTDKVEISLSGNSPYDSIISGDTSFHTIISSPDVYNKRITLSWVAATDVDQQVLASYGDIFHAPAYLIEMKPQLCIDGKVVKEGQPCGLGYKQSLSMVVKSPNSEDAIVTNTVISGGIYCIALDYGSIGAEELSKINNNIKKLQTSIKESNIYTEAAMGELLNAISKAYFAQLDLYNKILAGQNNVTETRALSIGMTGYSVDVKYTFQIPAEIKQGSLYIDIDRDIKSVVSNNYKNNENQKIFMLQSGIFASAMEHRVLEQMTGVEAVSTIKVLEMANKQGIPICSVTKDNYNDVIDTIEVSKSVKDTIKTSVMKGDMVIIPKSEVQIYDWSGSGYIVLDTETYAAGYMISGGLAGGAMSITQMLSEYVTYVVEGLVSMILLEILQAILSALIGNWAIVLIWGISLIFLIVCIRNIMDLVTLYKATGDICYLQEIVVQIGAIVTLGFIRLGPAKQAFDSLQTFTYSLTTLAKTGASTDTCMAFIKTYGTARVSLAERAIGAFQKYGFSDTQLATLASNFSYDYIAAIETNFAKIGVISSEEIDYVFVIFKQAPSAGSISSICSSLAAIKKSGIALTKISDYGITTMNGINALSKALGNGIFPSTISKLLEIGVGAGLYDSLDITSESKAEEYIKNIEKQKDISKAKQIQIKSFELADKYGFNKEKSVKTVAYDGTTYTLSGWKPLTDMPEFNRKITPGDVIAKCKEIGYTLTNSGAADQGVPGQYNASHAEKQLSLLTNDPIGVSNAMCKDCIRYFSKLAIAENRKIIVADPVSVRIFYPDGSIDTSN